MSIILVNVIHMYVCIIQCILTSIWLETDDIHVYMCPVIDCLFVYLFDLYSRCGTVSV